MLLIFKVRYPFHETCDETHAGTTFLSVAGLSYCRVYMILGRYETFILERYEKSCCWECNSCWHENLILNTFFSHLGDLKTKFSLFRSQIFSSSHVKDA